MGKIRNSKQLREAIEMLEAEQTEMAVELKQKFNNLTSIFKPANLVRKALGDVLEAPDIVGTLLSSLVSIAAGYFSKKMIVKGSKKILKRIFGVIMQYGVTYLVASNADIVREKGKELLEVLLRKSKTKKTKNKSQQEAEPVPEN